MELNEYDKEFLVSQSQSVSELMKITGKTKGRLSEYKDFVYKDKQVYLYNNKYYYN